MEFRIVLVPIGDIEQNLLEKLKNELSIIFHPLHVTISDAISIPKGAFNPKRRQYYSSPFLKALIKCVNSKTSKFLGITSLDLYTNGLNFIFGQAVIDGGVCVISTHRLRPEFYGQPYNEKIFLERSTKEAVHELGHSFALKHCPNPRCVMFFSNQVLDTDLKSKNFCEKCQSQIMRKQSYKRIDD
ncbi:MAG: archaemetzincin family Zn-dependent metalloprotease [Candidatus Jordarchaeum sp.]|uniref:archaemetzincin family Zn-dependent metalloprotease n=1 Tax=Candidatus Jordarchaeum sp. TaxID=2823881 RepID=UPI0040494F3A